MSEKIVSKEVWSKNILTHENDDPKKLGPKSFVKIRRVTAEILLIWTNVARVCVAWTNVTMTVGPLKTWSQDPTFKRWSRSGQYQLRYS